MTFPFTESEDVALEKIKDSAELVPVTPISRVAHEAAIPVGMVTSKPLLDKITVSKVPGIFRVLKPIPEFPLAAFPVNVKVVSLVIEEIVPIKVVPSVL